MKYDVIKSPHNLIGSYILSNLMGIDIIAVNCFESPKLIIALNKTQNKGNTSESKHMLHYHSLST